MIKSLTQYKWVLSALLVTALTAGFFAFMKAGDVTRDTGDFGSAKSYAVLVQTSLSVASNSNLDALQRYQAATAAVFADPEHSSATIAGKAAAAISSMRSSAQLIGRAAYDQARSTHTANEYVSESIGQKIVDPALQDIADDVTRQMALLQNALDKSTVRLAADIASAAPLVAYTDQRTVMASDLQKALRGTTGDYSREAGFFAVFAAVDAVAIPGIASRIFAKQITKVAAAAAVAALDGPLPIGDVISALLLGWSAWEIYQLRAKFEVDTRVALHEYLDGVQTAMRKQAVDAGDEGVASVQRQQHEIAAAAFRQANLKGSL